MANHIGKAEFAFSIAPVKFFRRNARNHLQRALTDFFVVVQKLASIGNFHKDALYCISWIRRRNSSLLYLFRPSAINRPSSVKQASSMAVKLKQALPCMRFLSAGAMAFNAAGL